MVDLIEKSPCEGLCPVEGKAVRLVEVPVAAITWIAPEPGWEKPVSQVLKELTGAGFPAPGRATGKAGARCIWFGAGQALLLGAVAPVLADAATADLSHGYVVLRLDGDDAAQVLARVIALDLRAAAFRRGHAARTMLRHVPVIVVKTHRQGFELVVPSPMARTAIEDISEAIRTVSAIAAG